MAGTVALIAVMAVTAPPAAAQFAGNSGGNIELSADDAETAGGVTVLTGQVDARQGEVRILADRMEIYSRPDDGGSGPSVGLASGNIDRIVATGNFYYLTPEQEVRGNRGVYMAATDTFEVTGDVILTQTDSVVRGTRLIYELATEKARVLADCQGRRCGRDGRVSILIKDTPAPEDSGAKAEPIAASG